MGEVFKKQELHVFYETNRRSLLVAFTEMN